MRIQVLAIVSTFIFVMALGCTPPPDKINPASTEEEVKTVEEAPTPIDQVSIDKSSAEEEIIGESERTPDVPEEIVTELTIPENMFGHYKTWPPDKITSGEADFLKKIIVVLETTKGTIRIKLFPESAPIHSANFAKLVQDGFYDGLKFHRVIAGFMSQGGDPQGTGQGGPGYTLPAEFGLTHEPGRVAAARLPDQVNPERRSSGSQFYMVHTREQCAQLDGQYSVFGEIIEGQEVNLSLAPERSAKLDSIVHAYLELAE